MPTTRTFPDAPEVCQRHPVVYRVRHDDMPGAPTIRHTISGMISAAKRRYAKTNDYDYHDITARKINDGNGWVDVVVVAPATKTNDNAT